VTTYQHEPGLPLRWIVAFFLAPVAMMLFALFAFKPLYQLWCRASGTQLRPNSSLVANAATVHTGRFIKVYFEATVLDHLPVSFSPRDSQQTVEVGTDGRNFYRFTNLTDHVLRMRPVHFISPINASRQFGMKVCFCFKDQVLAAGESREYPVVFTFAPALDERIHTVSICYTLFALTPSESDKALDQRIEKTVGQLGGVVSPRRDPSQVSSASQPVGTP
jgi:cytochrome c oxidase assembly protein subunit 11